MRAGAAAVLVLALLGAAPVAAEPATVEIASLAEALTFARVASGDGARVLAVTRYEGDRVEGVDLSLALGRPATDPIGLFLALGYDALESAITDAPAEARTTVAAGDLGLPAELGDRHVAAGTNFPEHAGEAEVEDGPFLFSKRVAPTGPYAPVSARDGLLDHEVELAWVTFEPIAEGETPAHLGVVVCNDFTDRAALIRHVNPSDVTSGDGFTTGKSFPGFLPVGTLLVIPRDYRAFAAATVLELSVNGEVRQREKASEMIWDLDELLAQTWARRDVTWEWRGERVSLLDDAGRIPARTLILSGTPQGTIFQGVSTGRIVAGLGRWMFGGWSDGVMGSVAESYIDAALADGRYLQPGDVVEIRVDRLGVIRNRVER